MEAYKMAINNIVVKMNSKENKMLIDLFPNSRDIIDAFKASDILSICFCKSKEEVIMDIILATKELKRLKLIK
jgi:hypothetical protein